MRKFVIGLVLGLLVLPVAFGLYVASGRFPVATSDPPLPFEKSLAGAGLYGRIHKEAPDRDVSGMSTTDLVAAAAIYQKNCAFCHGLPRQPVSVAAKGMYPGPPQLFTADGGVTDDAAGVTYWKVKNGIRLTGMPGFQASLGDEDLWRVTALVARADKLDPAVMDALKPAAPVLLISAGADQAMPTAPAAPSKPPK
jgi:thiosulfate dehydrogenase